MNDTCTGLETVEDWMIYASPPLAIHHDIMSINMYRCGSTVPVDLARSNLAGSTSLYGTCTCSWILLI